MSGERELDLEADYPQGSIERMLAESWRRMRPTKTDIGLRAEDGSWLILRWMPDVLPPAPRIAGLEVDGDKVVWRIGDRMLVTRTTQARFICLCELLEMFPDADVMTATKWGEES